MLSECIILAGGLGTRLQSVVNDVPKVLADINGKPFLHYILEEVTKQKNNNADVFNRQANAANAVSKKELNNYFTAQVVATDNSPLPFTNISIKKENFGTYADAKGMVRLVSTDSVLNIEVKSVGYLPRTLYLRSNQPQNKIVLQEDEVALKDRTVIGNKDISANRKSRRATLLTDSVVNVEPADGWANYNTYVANNIEIPEEMLKNDFHGEVELTFDVKANGTISNIQDVSIELPSTVATAGSAPVGDAAHIDAAGILKFKGKAVTAADIASLWFADDGHSPAAPFQIVADKRLPAVNLLRRLQEFKSAGFENLSIITLRDFGHAP